MSEPEDLFPAMGPFAARRWAEATRLMGHADPEAMLRRYAGHALRSPAQVARDEARSRLAGSLAALRFDVEGRLCELYRAHLGDTVLAASPLVLDACRMEGIDLDGLAWSLRPDGEWRPWLGGSAARLWLSKRLSACGTPSRLDERVALSRFMRSGVIVREAGNPSGALGFRPGARCLEIGMLTEMGRLVSSGGRGVLTLASPIPETLRIALPGRWLDEFADHPLFRGRPYRIRAAVLNRSDRTVVTFGARSVPWRMPWARRDDGASAGPQGLSCGTRG